MDSETHVGQQYSAVLCWRQLRLVSALHYTTMFSPWLIYVHRIVSRVHMRISTEHLNMYSVSQSVIGNHRDAVCVCV